MGFSDAVRTCLREKYVTFQGRASRSEYWYFFLFYLLAIAVLTGIPAIIAGLMGAFEGEPSGAVFAIFVPAILFVLAMILPLISVQVRRLHDRDMSGWWYLGFILLSAIPFLGFAASIANLVINCLKGTEGPNRFGNDPLGAEYSADVFS